MKYLTLLWVGLVAASALAESGRFENLGVQVTATTVQGTTFAKEADGRDVVCSVIRGDPGKLLVFDVRSGALIHRMPLAKAHGAWNACTASDGSVYVGTDDNGHLYRWIPGEKEVRDLGLVLADQTFVWDVAAGADGEVFAATYGGCNVVRYHPKGGFRDVGGGNVSPPENYARGVAYDRESGKVYVGVGAHAHLIELDPKTGAKRDILSDKFREEKKFCYAVDVVAGKIVAQITEGGQAIVMDAASHELEAVLEGVVGQQVVSPKSPAEEKFYYSGQTGVCAYDLKTRKAERVAAIPSQIIIGMTWIDFGDGAELVVVGRPGKLTRYHPRTGKVITRALDVPAESVMIQSICRGPDGKIYCGGYLSGGLTAFDPQTSKGEQRSMGQPEGMATLGTELFLGIYPNGRLYAYDTAKPWDAKNPRLLDTLDRFEQDRPMAVLGVEKLNKVLFGTIPDYGLLGGAIVVYDARSGKVEVHRNVVQDQSVIGLAYANDLIVGSTSISGGLGTKPTAKEAKLFLWDPVKKEKVFEVAPVAGAWMITGLMNGPDGNIWGVADSMLFIFDPVKREIVFKKQAFVEDDAERHARWRDAFLAVHPNGNIYGTVSGRLYRIDPKTREATELRKQSSLFAMDDDGRIYFRQGTDLMRYTP